MNNQTDTEKRLVKLEENVYFLEEHLKALDSQIAVQQTQLDNLHKQVLKMQAVLTEMREFLASGHGKNDDQTPPHHVARFW